MIGMEKSRNYCIRNFPKTDFSDFVCRPSKNILFANT